VIDFERCKHSAYKRCFHSV